MCGGEEILPMWLYSVCLWSCTSTWGKSYQVRFLRLRGVMSESRFPSNHWDHILGWPGFRIVMPKSSGRHIRYTNISSVTLLLTIFVYLSSLISSHFSTGCLLHRFPSPAACNTHTFSVLQWLLQQCDGGIRVSLKEQLLHSLRAEQFSS